MCGGDVGMRNCMVALAGGAFMMGSNLSPEEGPIHEEWVEPFELDQYAVTNWSFAGFVQATRYETVAERRLESAAFSGTILANAEPGSLVFTPTAGPVDLRDWRQWWRWVPGSNWRHPQGPKSTIQGKDEHPVVQIAYEDAAAYADWAGGRLPSEVEWEYAARGGLAQATFTWGEAPNNGMRANTWQGRFPYFNSGAGTGAWTGTAPVGSFPPNGFGLHEMAGNTWEWTSTQWTDRLQDPALACQCGPPAAGVEDSAPSSGVALRVVKGGSYLCAPEYCLRFRPAARSAQSEDSSTTHIGFRCAR